MMVTFYGYGQVWDPERNKVLCTFKNGSFGTKDSREIDIIRKNKFKETVEEELEALVSVEPTKVTESKEVAIEPQKATESKEVAMGELKNEVELPANIGVGVKENMELGTEATVIPAVPKARKKRLISLDD